MMEHRTLSPVLSGSWWIVGRELTDLPFIASLTFKHCWVRPVDINVFGSLTSEGVECKSDDIDIVHVRCPDKVFRSVRHLIQVVVVNRRLPQLFRSGVDSRDSIVFPAADPEAAVSIVVCR